MEYWRLQSTMLKGYHSEYSKRQAARYAVERLPAARHLLEVLQGGQRSVLLVAEHQAAGRERLLRQRCGGEQDPDRPGGSLWVLQGRLAQRRTEDLAVRQHTREPEHQVGERGGVQHEVGQLRVPRHLIGRRSVGPRPSLGLGRPLVLDQAHEVDIARWAVARASGRRSSRDPVPCLLSIRSPLTSGPTVKPWRPDPQGASPHHTDGRPVAAVESV
jgi:hypothetical protein